MDTTVLFLYARRRVVVIQCSR